MDHRRFDALSRRLATSASRRTVLGAATALVIGGAAAGNATAATRCRGERKTCTRNTQCCSGLCQVGREVPLRERNRCSCPGDVICGQCFLTPVSEKQRKDIVTALC
jgi:hypothetical protein